MAEMVGSAVVQEALSSVSSFVSGKLEDKAARVHLVARLEMAISDLELALERSGKMPITDVALLRRRKMLKQAYIEGTDLLNKHKLEGRQEAEQVVAAAITVPSFLERVTRAAKLCIPSLFSLDKGYLSSSVVQVFERFADCVGKFLRDVESGCSLRHQMLLFSNPLLRHLFEGNTLWYRKVQGSQKHDCYIWPARLEERGIEALLRYVYLDLERPEKCFNLGLMLRLSEDTDVVGVAIKCLQLLASQFNIVVESAMGELNLLATSNSQDMSHSYAPPSIGIREWYTQLTQKWRPDPACCTATSWPKPCDNNIVPSEPSHILPKQVIGFLVEFCIPVPEYRLRISSCDDTRDCPHLLLITFVIPHFSLKGVQQDYAVFEVSESETERINVSKQQIFEMIRSKAIEYFVRQPELTDYGVTRWFSKHGVAIFMVEKPSPLQMLLIKSAARRINFLPKTRRRAAKRRRVDP